MSLLRRRMMMQTEGDEDMKEWQLFKTIDFANEDEQLEFFGLNFTELFFIGTGLCNISESQESAVEIHINDEVIAKLTTQKSNGSMTKNQQLHLKYNGLFWEQTQMPQSNNAESYYLTYSYKQAPYAANLNTKKCESLIFGVSNSIYKVKSGTIRIYAR